jgi:ATP/maltotriose-dependent transcriptional regulator MalT
MTMSFLLHESPSDFEISPLSEPLRAAEVSPSALSMDAPAIIDGQICPPEIGPIVERPRLIDLLERSGSQFGATLLTGRAGTGKTTLAADYASEHERVAWYSVESGDSNWKVFSSYFFASISGCSGGYPRSLVLRSDESVDDSAAADFLRHCFAGYQRNKKKSPELIVIDDIHHLFDTVWFAGFFDQLIRSLVPGLHLLMTCRSKPPAPLWRMRSKQMLNVIDEAILEFSVAEAQSLCRLRKLPTEIGTEAHRCSGGRIRKTIEFIDRRSNKH